MVKSLQNLDTHKMKQQLFSFFCAEKSNNLSEIFIVIDDSFKDMQEIYDYIGKCVYGNFPEKKSSVFKLLLL